MMPFNKVFRGVIVKPPEEARGGTAEENSLKG